MNAFAGTLGLSPPIEVLTLALQGDIFALNAHHVREILDPVPVTEVPGALHSLAGLINVRGKVLPLLDLCLRLDMQPTPPTIDTRFIVVEVSVRGLPVMVGVRADRVFEMTELATDAMEDTPQIGMQMPAKYVRCIGKRAGQFLVVLDLEKIFEFDSEEKTPSINRRRHRRLKVSLRCHVDIGGGRVPAQIADLSEGGAAITGLAQRPQIDHGQMEIDNLKDTLNFKIVSYDGGTLRLKFDEPGHPALNALVRRLEEKLGPPT